MSERASRVTLAVIVGAGLGLRLWGIQFGFPHPFARTDEEVIVDVALGVLRDPNPHFYDWPTFFMYVLGATYAALFAVERAVGGSIRHAAIAKSSYLPVLHLTARVLAAACGTLTIAALYAAAREAFSTRVSLIAAALLAVVFLHVRDSHFGVTDVPATFFVVCAFWAVMICAQRGPTTRRVVVTGVLSGLAVATKYNTALILLPAAAVILIHVGRERGLTLARAMQLVIVLGLTAGGSFLVTTPYAILDHGTFLPAVLGVRDHLARGHVVMARGWTYHTTFTFRYGIGYPLLVAGILGLCWLLARRRRDAVLLLAFMLPYYVLLGSGKTVFARYMMPLVPFLCLAAAIFVDRASAPIARLFARGRFEAASAWLLAAAIAAPTVYSSILFDRLMTRTDTRVLGAEWVAAQFPSGATMFQTGFGSGHLQMTPRAFFPQFRYNETANRFEFGGAEKDRPDVIVIQESPLWAYAQVPERIRGIVAEGYVQSMVFESAKAGADALYDQEDAFYAPYTGLENVARPGPTLTIFRRRDEPVSPAGDPRR